MTEVKLSEMCLRYTNPGSAYREQYQEEASFLAFLGHLTDLGKFASVVPDIAAGNTNVSLPAYFSEPKFRSNPLNTEALRLIVQRETDGNSRTCSRYKDDTALRSAITSPKTILKAAKSDQLYAHILGTELGLNTPVIQGMYPIYTGSFDVNWQNTTYKRADILNELARQICQPCRADIVKPIEEQHAFVTERGYEDFFDYLFDIRKTFDSQVTEVFTTQSSVAN